MFDEEVSRVYWAGQLSSHGHHESFGHLCKTCFCKVETFLNCTHYINGISFYRGFVRFTYQGLCSHMYYYFRLYLGYYFTKIFYITNISYIRSYKFINLSINV